MFECSRKFLKSECQIDGLPPNIVTAIVFSQNPFVGEKNLHQVVVRNSGVFHQLRHFQQSIQVVGPKLEIMPVRTECCRYASLVRQLLSALENIVSVAVKLIQAQSMRHAGERESADENKYGKPQVQSTAASRSTRNLV